MNTSRVIGGSLQRMDDFSADLLNVLSSSCAATFTWSVLPNHYHALVEAADLRIVTRALGRLHGRTSFHWKIEDQRRGRSVFYRTADRAMRSEGHFGATPNYIHHNPVHHGYATRWTDWPWSSAVEYLETVGWNEAARRWKAFPILDYGKAWDDPEQ